MVRNKKKEIRKRNFCCCISLCDRCICHLMRSHICLQFIFCYFFQFLFFFKHLNRIVDDDVCVNFIVCSIFMFGLQTNIHTNISFSFILSLFVSICIFHVVRRIGSRDYFCCTLSFEFKPFSIFFFDPFFVT